MGRPPLLWMRSSQDARAKGNPSRRSQSMVSFLSAKPCRRDGRHPVREAAARAGLQVRQEFLLFLAFVSHHAKPLSQNQRRVRAL